MPPRKATHTIPESKKRKGKASGVDTQEEQMEEQTELPQMPMEQHDRSKFMNRSKQQRFTMLEVRGLLYERKVELDIGQYEEFQAELRRRKWEKLAAPMERVNEQIVKEFYANAWPMKKAAQTRKSWVRGKIVPYDRAAINNFLGNPLTLAEGELCAYQKKLKLSLSGFSDWKVADTLCIPNKTYEANDHGKALRIKRANMRTITQIWTSFILANITPNSHTSDITMQRAYLIYAILKKMTVDIAAIISAEIHKFVLSTPSQKAAASKPLGFPALINALCIAHGVSVPSHPQAKLKMTINENFIKNYCVNPAEKNLGESSSRPAPVRQPSMTPMETRLTAHLTHIEQQQAANHRAYTSLNDSFYRFSLNQQQGDSNPFPWPTPDEFAAHVAWPGDSPILPEGVEHEDEESNEGQAPDDAGNDGDDFMEDAGDDFMEEIMRHH